MIGPRRAAILSAPAGTFFRHAPPLAAPPTRAAERSPRGRID
jgi:hypothetical protein